LAPTSIPRVGSSSSSTEGSVISHLASATFCWLPPLSALTSASTEAVFTESMSTNGWASANSRSRSTQPGGPARLSEASVALWSTDIDSTSPVALRSLVSRAMPLAMASAGRVIDAGRPPTATAPAATRP